MCNNSIYTSIHTYYIYYYLHVHFHIVCVRACRLPPVLACTSTKTTTKGFTCHIVNTLTGLGIWTVAMDIQIVWYQWWWMYRTQWTGQIDLCCAWIDGTTRTSTRWWSESTWTGNGQWNLLLPFVCLRNCWFPIEFTTCFSTVNMIKIRLTRVISVIRRKISQS